MQWELTAIGERIREARESLGWSIEWAAIQAGLTVKQMQIIEEGELDYSANHLALVLKAMMLPPNLVFGWGKD